MGSPLTFRNILHISSTKSRSRKNVRGSRSSSSKGTAKLGDVSEKPPAAKLPAARLELIRLTSLRRL